MQEIVEDLQSGAAEKLKQIQVLKIIETVWSEAVRTFKQIKVEVVSVRSEAAEENLKQMQVENEDVRS